MTDHTLPDTTTPGSRITAALTALAAAEEEIRAAHAQPEAVKATWKPFWASILATRFHKAQQEVLDAITAELPALLAMVTAADAFVRAFTTLQQPWMAEKSREAIHYRKVLADAVAAYQAARSQTAREEGS